MLTLLAAFALMTQDAPVATAPPAAEAVAAPHDVAVLPGSSADPTCGGRADLSIQAFCILIPAASTEAVGTSYVRDLEAKGWLAASAEGGRIVLVRRHDGGGCDALQLLVSETADGSNVIAFGAIPGDVCAAAGPTAQ